MNQIYFPKTWNIQLLSTILFEKKKSSQTKIDDLEFSKFQIVSKLKHVGSAIHLICSLNLFWGLDPWLLDPLDHQKFLISLST